MQGLHSHLQAARSAAGRLRESLSQVHEGHHFRRDYQKLLDKAADVLRHIEQATEHAPEVVLGAVTKLNQANGLLAKALREESTTKLSTLSTFTGRTPSHSESYKNAERLLSEALVELRRLGTIGSSGAALQQPDSLLELRSTQPWDQPSDSSLEQIGQLTKYGRNVGGVYGSITAVGLGPGPAGSAGNLCVAVSSMQSSWLDLYTGCREKQLKSLTLDKKAECLAFDAGSNTVWTGHADGTIRLHQVEHAATESADLQCNVAVATCCQDVPVRSLTIEVQDQPTQPRCWAGDAQGRVCVRQLWPGPLGPQLLDKVTAAPEFSSQKSLPVDAMLHVGAHMLVSCGHQWGEKEPLHKLQLWDCKALKSGKDFVCRCGPVTCLEVVGPSLTSPASSGGQAAVESVASHRSSGDAGDSSSSAGSSGSCYRVLSGHAAGQVVLWELRGRGAAATLHELAVIGEHKEGRVVKSIFAFPAWDMLVVATSSTGLRNLGKLRLMHLPSDSDLDLAKRRSAEGMARPHRVAQPTVDLPTYVHDAHTQQILATARQGETMVTASNSSIRFWSPRQLAMYAAKGDKKVSLLFSRAARTSSSGASTGRRPSDGDALTAEVSFRSDSSNSMTSPFERQQQEQQAPQQQQAQPKQKQQQQKQQQLQYLNPFAQQSAALPIEIPVGPPSVQQGSSSSWHGPGYSITPVAPTYPALSQQSPVGFTSTGARSSTPPPAGPVPYIPPLGFGSAPQSGFGGQPLSPVAPKRYIVGMSAPWQQQPQQQLPEPFAAAATAGGANQAAAFGWAGAQAQAAAVARAAAAQRSRSPMSHRPASPLPYGGGTGQVGFMQGYVSFGAGAVPGGASTARQGYAHPNPMSRQPQRQQMALQAQQPQQQELPQQRQQQRPPTQPMATVTDVRSMDPEGLPSVARAGRPAASPGSVKPRPISAEERFDSASSTHGWVVPQSKKASAATAPAAMAAGAAPGSSARADSEFTFASKAAAAAAGSSGGPSAQQQPDITTPSPSERQPGAAPRKEGLQPERTSDALHELEQHLQREADLAEAAQHSAADLPAQLQAELSAHCGYQFVRVLPDKSQFGSSRAVQARCSRTNRLRTLLQIPREQLQQLAAHDPLGLLEFQQQLVAASDLHHPHMLQVQEVFVGPLHLHVVLEECSAGRLLDYPARQADAWGLQAAGAGAAAPAALSPEYARWFFQQVVLAVHFYHTRIGNGTDGREALHPSKLSIKNSVLKVMPSLPQPVVKVPTEVLACGLAAYSLTASPGSTKPGDDPYVAPEAYASMSAGKARHDTPAGDVWACGVLLLKLLGGQLKPAVYSHSTASKLPASELFDLPAQSGRGLVDQQLRELLAWMLQPRVGNRITLQRLQQHPWYKQGLPKPAENMTDRYIQASIHRACKQSEAEIEAAVLAAAAAPDEACMQLMRQVQHKQAAGQQLTAGKQQLHHLQPMLLQGPSTPELQHGLRLMAYALHQASLQLGNICVTGTQGSSSASRLTELVVAQHTAAYAASTATCMERAAWLLGAMQKQLLRWEGPKRPFYAQRQRDSLGMALLLQAPCSEALYSIRRLLQLLQGVEEPSLWCKLQHSIPAQGKAAKGGQPDAVAAERLHHLLKLQVYLLNKAHAAMRSLWICRAVSAAVSKACTGRKQVKHAAGGKANLLTAVLGSAGQAWLSMVAAAATQQDSPLGEDLTEPQQQVFGKGYKQVLLFPKLAAVVLLLLVQLNQHSQDQQQRQQRSWVPVQFVDCLEQLDGVLVSKAPESAQQSDVSSSSAAPAAGSSCVVYSGTLQQGGEKVLVVGLQQLSAPGVRAQVSQPAAAGTSKGLPLKRIEAKVQRLQAQFQASVNGAMCCPICLGVLTDPVNAADRFVYCRACIEQYISELQAAGKPVVSPYSREPLSDTTLVRNMHLQSWIQDWRTQEAQNLRKVQQQVQEQVQQQQELWHEAADSKQFKASEHLGLAHAAEPSSRDAVHTFRQLLHKLQMARVLSGISVAASGSSSTQQQALPLLAPIHTFCAEPPLLVVPEPVGGTLDQWMRSTASRVSAAGVRDFSVAWVEAVPHKLVLRVLSDVAAALATLHQQQPAVVHGVVHAAAVHLTQQLPEGAAADQQEQAGNTRVAQLSLSGLLSQLSPISSVHPFLCAPEVLLASGPPTPAADVYGFGVLLFQLATGWLPQQYTPGTDEQIHTVMWCMDMMTQAGSMSPLAAAQVMAHSNAGQWTPYGQHMPSVAAMQQLPPGYLSLMEQCLHREALARPCMQHVVAALQQWSSQDPSAAAGAAAIRPSLMLEALHVVEARRASADFGGQPTAHVHVQSQVSPTRG